MTIQYYQNFERISGIRISFRNLLFIHKYTELFNYLEFSMFLRNVCELLPRFEATHPIWGHSCYPLLSGAAMQQDIHYRLVFVPEIKTILTYIREILHGMLVLFPLEGNKNRDVSPSSVLRLYHWQCYQRQQKQQTYSVQTKERIFVSQLLGALYSEMIALYCAGWQFSVDWRQDPDWILRCSEVGDCVMHFVRNLTRLTASTVSHSKSRLRAADSVHSEPQCVAQYEQMEGGWLSTVCHSAWHSKSRWKLADSVHNGPHTQQK
jgi:hypothetical protein